MFKLLKIKVTQNASSQACAEKIWGDDFITRLISQLQHKATKINFGQHVWLEYWEIAKLHAELFS